MEVEKAMTTQIEKDSGFVPPRATARDWAGLVVLALALAYAQFADNPHVAGALRGMGAVAAGLITATGLKLMGALQKHPLGRPLCALLGALAFVAIAWWKLPLAWVLFGLGGVACVLTYRKLA